MHTIFRQALGTVIGGLIVAAIFLAPRAFAFVPSAFAQDNITVVGQTPTVVEGGEGASQATNQISYQGVLFNPFGQPVPNGNYNMIFTIYDAPSGGNILGQASQAVSVTNGMFSALITFTGGLEAVLTGSDRWIGITIGNDPEATPRQKVTYVPYAIWARTADQVDDKGSDWMPIAFGIVDRNGGFVNNRQRGFNSANVGSDNFYEITVTGQNYDSNRFVAQVTPVNTGSGAGDCPTPTSALTSSSGGQLLIEMYDRNGDRVRCRFGVIVWRP